jgi:tetratricopeptide (TPR) repeat protein
MVLAAGAYVRSRRTRQWGWMGVAGVMAVLAAYSKETAVALPMWILLIEAVFYRDRWRWDRRLLLLIPMVMIIALPAWQIFRSSSERTLTQVPLADHLASGGSVLLKYLQLAVFPVDQYLRYDIQAGEPAIGGLATSWVVIVVLVGVAVWLGARGRIAGFGLLTFFILLLPMTLLPLPDLIFEYRAYPGMVGLVLAAGMLLQPRSVRISRSGLVLSAGLLLVFGPRTFQQVGAWNDDLAFYEAHRDRFPTDPYTLSDLGIRYHSRGEVETALETFEQARLYEGRFNPYYSEVGRLNIALNTTTVLLSLRDFDRAGEELARARELRPDERAVLLMEGAYQTARGEPEQAVEPYRRLTELYPDDPQGWYWLTQIHLQLGNEQAAALAAEEFTALDQTPASPARPAEMSETTRTAGTFALVFVIVALSGFSALWTVSHLRRNWPHLVGRKVEDPAPKSEPPGPTS